MHRHVAPKQVEYTHVEYTHMGYTHATKIKSKKVSWSATSTWSKQIKRSCCNSKIHGHTMVSTLTSSTRHAQSNRLKGKTRDQFCMHDELIFRTECPYSESISVGAFELSRRNKRLFLIRTVSPSGTFSESFVLSSDCLLSLLSEDDES